MHQTLGFLTEALIDSLTATWQNCASFFPLDPLSTAVSPVSPVSPVSSVSDSMYWLRSMRKQVNSVFGKCIFQGIFSGQETTTHPILDFLRPRRITWPFATWTERMSGSSVVDNRSYMKLSNVWPCWPWFKIVDPQTSFRCLKCVWTCWALVAKIWWPKPLRCSPVNRLKAILYGYGSSQDWALQELDGSKSGNTSIWN